MKKVFTLLTLLLCVVSSAWADDTDLIVSWKTTPTLSNNSDGCTTTGTSYNVATWSDGTSIKIMRSDKAMSNGSDITIGGTKYKSIKVSNGAQNLLTMPANKLAYSVTIYSYVNADDDNKTSSYWSEVNGDNTQTTAMTSFKDGTNPDVRTYNLGGVSSFTFTNRGKQLCYVMVISTVAKQQATLAFETTSGQADLADGTSFTLPTLTKNPTDLAVTYSSTNENVATVNTTTGAVTLQGIGTTTIKASFEGNDSYYAASAEYELTVTNSAVTTISVTYDISSVADIEGYAPSSFTINEGESFTIPANQTLYVEGKTLTGWAYGTTIYNIGDDVTALGTDMTLVPIFEDNAAEAYLGHNASSITWNFKKSTGAPLWNQLQGTGATTIYVVQATVGSNTIDVKMDMDATNGKIDNSSNDNWTQMNTGTKLTVPVVVGSTLELKVYKEGTTPVTFGGVAGTYNSNLYTYTATEAGTLDIVMGENDQSYCEYLTVTYPSESAVYTYSEANEQVLLTKANINDKDYLTVNPTDKWATGKTYGGYSGDFFNMSNNRTLTIKVTGASMFELFVMGNEGRGYSVQVGEGASTAITKAVSGVEASGVFEIADPTVVTTITLKGTGDSVYPVYFLFNPLTELTTTATMGGWKSFYDKDYGYEVDDNTKAYVATLVQQGASAYEVVLDEIEAVPAGVAVLLKTNNQVTESPDGHYSMMLTKNEYVNVPDMTNLLKASAAATNTAVYRLGSKDGKVGFFEYNVDTAQPNVVVLDWNSNVTNGARELYIRFADDETTGISNVNDNVNLNKVVFDLQGRRVAQPGKGLYIVNGKKVVIK